MLGKYLLFSIPSMLSNGAKVGGMLKLLNQTLGAWTASLMSTATILNVRLLKCSCAMKTQKDVIANMADIEIYDFMRAAERRIYYFAYEVSIYSEKMWLSGECQ